MFLGPDTIMGAGAAEEPAGPGVRGSCVNKSLLHRLKRETQAPWKSGKLMGKHPRVSRLGVAGRTPKKGL